MIYIQWQDLLFIVFCVITGVQLFYYLYFFMRLAFYKAPVRSVAQQHPVSVIICARDEAQNLADHLPDVLQQEYKSTYEVVAVNDNSYDDSKYVLEYLSKPFRHLRPIDLKQEARLIQGKKFPLSMGIKEARYELLLLTDADCSPASPHWVERMQHAFAPGKEIALGYGAYTKEPGLLNKLIRFETFLTALQYFSYALAGRPYMGVGRNLAYKKELFLRNKGFSMHNQLPGGDDDLFINRVATRTNTAIVPDPEAFTYSKAKNSWSGWRQQKARHYSASRYYKPLHKFLLSLYAASQFLFFPLLIASVMFYHVWIPLAVYGGRLLILGLVYFRSMKQLREADLFWIYPLLDIWQWFYYILFADTLVRKPKNTW
ncbi:MAG TPA: glycosyltransferase [Lacibacter sp.]|nr:glycosyltransferase [Lacibacter sp.]HMO87708.1 glycosyltransferase [Lacibacter sp.]